METLQIIVLSLIQGLTEFLPISSSAHLILVPHLVEEWTDQGIAFDVAVHVGTLTAVIYYFRQELGPMVVDWGASLVTRRQTKNSMLMWAVLLGTIPVGVAGLLLRRVIEAELRTPLVLAVGTIVFGLLLWVADIMGKRVRDEHTIVWKDVLIIGCAQALALIPGTSRSGVTMTAGLMVGLTREAAARFSFLLSIPVITLSGVVTISDLIGRAAPVDWGAIVSGAVLAGLAAYFTIHFFLKLLARTGMLPYVIYRLILGCVLLYYFYPA